jgi:hypothetical protein
MVRCTAKTALGRRCKKSGTRHGLCHIHESAAPVAIDPRRSRGGGPELDYQPQQANREALRANREALRANREALRANREGPNDGAHPEFIALSRRRTDLITRVQTLSLEIHRHLARRNTAWLALLSRNLATMVTPLQQIRTQHNSRVAAGLTRDMDDIQQRLERGEVEVREEIRNRQDQERVLEQARQRAREAIAQQVRADAERAERAAQLREDLRLRPVVFRRDPEGGIDLRAFAEDAQSVHRSSVQNATHKAVVELLSRTAPPADQDTLPEIVGVFNISTTLRWTSPEARDAVVTELTDNYFNAVAFNIAYGRVVDYIWAYIRGHAEKAELIQRLAEELYEGRGMCANGKMARLINVVQGYDESLENPAPRELFQQRMGELSSKPVAERESAARELFAEFRIPEAEHAAWLEPLLEA